MTKFLYPGIIVMIVALMGFAAWFTLSFGRGTQVVSEAAQPAALNLDDTIAAPDPLFPSDSENEGIFVYSDRETPAIARILPHTRIVYDYYYPISGGFETVVEYPAHYLLDMTEDDLAAMFADWQVMSFSSYEVHLRQNTQTQYRLYVIGVHDGYIAVFYDDEYYSIKELTNRPIAALAAEEQQRLLEGIKVTGTEELMRALEDFSS